MKYEEMLKYLPNLIENNTYEISMLANFSAFLFEHLEQVNWVGFYINIKQILKLGPFQGKIACTEIPFTKGVCGHCAITQKTIMVPNVCEFKGHIACDTQSKSEICIPIFFKEKVYAILDIDSPILNRFSIDDKRFLEQATKILEKELEKILL